MNSSRLQRRMFGRIILLIIVILLIVTAYKAYRAATIARQLYTQVERLRADAGNLVQADDLPGSVETLRGEFHTFYTDWNRLQGAIWPFDEIGRSFTWLPQYGDDLDAALKLADIADATLESMILLDQTFAPLLANPSNELLSEATLFQVSDLISAAPQNMELAQAHAADALAIQAQLPTSRGGLHPLLAQVIRQVEGGLPLLYLSTTAIGAAPDGLGIQAPHHILVLIQNADEIRPTGGFITGVAYLTMENGTMSDLHFMHSTDRSIDRWDNVEQYTTPPDPFRIYMGLPLWLFRDANWSPDFPTSARKAAELFTIGTELPVDTVVAINQYSVEEMLKMTGSVTLPDGEVVNSTNFIEVAQASWALGFEMDRDRKQILTDLGPHLINAVTGVSTPREASIALQTFQTMGKQKKLFVYSTEPRVQEVAQALSLDGTIPAAFEGDYIHIVDTNMGYDKTGLNIEQRFDYHVSLQDISQPFSILTTQYINNVPNTDEVCPSLIEGRSTQDYELRTVDCFANYLRLYLPDHTEMQSLPYFEIPEEYDLVDAQIAGQVAPIPDERNKEVVAGLMVVPPGQTIIGRFAYRLDPDVILQKDNNLWTYPLLIQKQSGIRPHPITLAIDLPTDATLYAVTPAPTAIRNNTVYFEHQFTEDMMVNIVFQTQDVSR